MDYDLEWLEKDLERPFQEDRSKFISLWQLWDELMEEYGYGKQQDGNNT